MINEQREPKLAMSNRFMNLQDQYLNSMMDVKAARNPTLLKRDGVVQLVEGRKSENLRSFSGRKTFRLESLFLLVCLTASLLILPLILPPLPPPPLMLLLLPICILALLMILAFVSSNVRDATLSSTHKYV
ncbi:protein AUXIN-REGULATED GENE INVOLVED IN ORGAN SIZE [Olea europaea var. sylvestris]|uniref:protein AUXIN-REGULATED GENE INVOLVED IN ORGAN SIZE n=1 Tax=Olea europaea var. sylvestris TaxID=158386 RepID=UPI000C1D8416|nr:protein AUXIN-REGULATED GENE INVOLVED IN ORGAN SIZE [Olea europaea var. sylvestris]